ncbi:MAG: outer membrane protein [Methylovirgula sp.]
MKRSFSAFLAGAALAALALDSAAAADLPSRSAAPYYPAPPLFTWTGFYVGANAGLNFGQFSDGGSNYFGNGFGGLYGITAGYNYQSGPLVAGLEADLNFGSVNGTGNPYAGVNGYGNVTGNGSLRGRFGYALDRALIYVTGGYTGASVKGSVADFGGTPNIYASQSAYLNGFTLGGGLEFAVTNNISLKGEYLFNDYGSSPYFSGTRDAITSGVSFSTLRAGINYHF